MILRDSAIKINNIQRSLSALIIFGLFFWLFFRYFSTKTTEIQSTETTLTLMNFANAEEQYFKEYNKYSPDASTLAAAYPSKNTEIYFTNKDVPNEYLKKIHENTMPYISQKSFRLLGVYKDLANHKIYMWIINNTKNVEYIGYLSY